MKILFVAIPNHHFFQWANQLKDAGHEVYWFNITDGGGFSSKISWVKQIHHWKLKFDYKGRFFVKKHFPGLYNFIHKRNTNDVNQVFEQKLIEIKPNIIHCFEMNLSGMPIFDTLTKYAHIPLIYSSWGSDMFDYESFGLSSNQVRLFLNRVNYLLTDCERDYEIALKHGFKNKFLGVFPGNGGITYLEHKMESIDKRKIILVKGYEDGVGKAIEVIKALENIGEKELSKFKIVVYSADVPVLKYVKESLVFQLIQHEIFPRNKHISNAYILELMGKSLIHIGNSISDGMPNVLLEAMGMGAFPIQSNPGRVTEEIIEHGVNGFLIQNPLEVSEIKSLITQALTNMSLLQSAQQYNIKFCKNTYNRLVLQSKIVALYQAL